MKVVFSEQDDWKSCRDLLVIPVVQDMVLQNALVAGIDRELDGALARAAGQEDFKGKVGQSLLLNTLGRVGAERVLLVGLGEADKLNPERRRRVAGRAAEVMRRIRAKEAILVCQEATGSLFLPGREAGAMIEGVRLALYRFGKYKSDPADNPVYDGPETLSIFVCNVAGEPVCPKKELEEAARRAEIVTEAVCAARDLINEIPQEMTPERLAEAAQEAAVGVGGLACRVLDEAGMEREKMGAALAVARGSDNRPRFIELSWTPRKMSDKDLHLVLVGKGVTFDSGGLNIKPGDSMNSMKADMSGAAAVISSIRAIARLKLPLRVTALVAAVENMPSGRSYRPDDIVRAMNGVTIEIGNTDAEGRLTLADALSWALARCKATRIVDLATLTGACMIALGTQNAGVFGNHDLWREQVLQAARESGEKCAPLPLDPDMADDIKSEVADVKNIGATRYGGAITAALFLQRFVGEVPWVHLDIAGPAWSDKRRDYAGPGGTGFGVRSLVRLAEMMSVAEK